MKWFLLLILILPAVSADWFLNSEQVLTHVELTAEAQIIKKSPNYKIDYLDINLSFFPQTTNFQAITNLVTTPQATLSKNAAQFRWENPTQEILRLEIKADIASKPSLVKVKKKIPFPVYDLADEFTPYREPSATIDSDNKEIFMLANELAAGETDLYVVVFKLGEWVKQNIDYNLSSLTADISQKSSWVIRTRQGVCDELTNLFIALLRSLGIPARFVSGIAYTNSPDFPEQWGAHGWAEVYFPGIGWIPWDVTYGEYGYVDPTHITMKVGLDADEASAQYRWFGYEIDVLPSKLDVSTTLAGFSGRVPDQISIEQNLFAKKVGFGSYNIIEAKVQNLQDYYVATEISLAAPKEVRILGSTSQGLLLEPGQEKNAFFLVQVAENLNPRYLYYFPLKLYSTRNVTAETQLNASATHQILSLDEARAVLNQPTDKKTFTQALDLSCLPEKTRFYEYEEVQVLCSLRNAGNTLLETLNVCLETECHTLDLGIAESKTVNFMIPTKQGIQLVAITAENQEVSARTSFQTVILDPPLIALNNVSSPESVRYEDSYLVSFILTKQSRSVPEKIAITLDNGLKKEWTLDRLESSKKFELKLPGSELSVGENAFALTATYEDENKRSYRITEGFQIALQDPKLSQRIAIFFKDIGKFMVNIFS